MATVDGYLESLPPERRAALQPVLDVVRANLPAGYEETMAWGMPCWQVPLSVYPDTYNKKPLMYVALASQKSHLAVYLCSLYTMPGERERFEAAMKAAGKKLDMGSACVRYKKPADLDLAAVAAAVASTPMEAYVAQAKAVHAATKTGKKKAAKAAPGAEA